MANMRVLLLPNSSDDNDVMPTVGEQQIAANFAVLKANKKRKINDEQLALETACLVQGEVQHWQNSIRELEALLHRELQGAVNAPPCPAVIAAEEDDPPSKGTDDKQHGEASSSSSTD